MTRYHLNDRGEPGICHAKHSCPFGDLAFEHYSSVEEARTHYEAKMKAYALGYTDNRPGVERSAEEREENRYQSLSHLAQDVDPDGDLLIKIRAKRKREEQLAFAPDISSRKAIAHDRFNMGKELALKVTQASGNERKILEVFRPFYPNADTDITAVRNTTFNFIKNQTGIDRSDLHHALDELVHQGVLTARASKSTTVQYTINRNIGHYLRSIGVQPENTVTDINLLLDSK